MAEIWELDAASIARAVAAGEASAADVVDAHLARIDSIDPEVHAFLTVTPELALCGEIVTGQYLNLRRIQRR